MHLVDEVTETMCYGPKINKAKEDYNSCLRIAELKKYEKHGRNFKRQICAGLEYLVNVKKFLKRLFTGVSK